MPHCNLGLERLLIGIALHQPALTRVDSYCSLLSANLIAGISGSCVGDTIASGSGLEGSGSSSSEFDSNDDESTQTQAETVVASTQHTCTTEMGVDFFGADVGGYTNVPLATADACAVMCQKHPLCQFFTYVWGACYLKTSDEGRAVLGPAVSGACPAAEPAAVGTLKSCSVSDPGFDFSGNDVEFGSNLAAVDAEACAALCAAHGDCMFFTFAWGGCYLKTADTGRYAAKPAMSGSCTVVAYDPPVAPTDTPVAASTDAPTMKKISTDAPTQAPVVASTDTPTQATILASIDAITQAPAVVSTDSPTTNQISTEPPVTYVGLNAGGVGCCRSEGGSAGSYTSHLNVQDLDICKNMCTKDVTCNGIELSTWSGCELHTTTPIAATDNHGACSSVHDVSLDCFIHCRFVSLSL